MEASYTLDEIRAAFDKTERQTPHIRWTAFQMALPDKRPPAPIIEPPAQPGVPAGFRLGEGWTRFAIVGKAQEFPIGGLCADWFCSDPECADGYVLARFGNWKTKRGACQASAVEMGALIPVPVDTQRPAIPGEHPIAPEFLERAERIANLAGAPVDARAAAAFIVDEAQRPASEPFDRKLHEGSAPVSTVPPVAPTFLAPPAAPSEPVVDWEAFVPRETLPHQGDSTYLRIPTGAVYCSWNDDTGGGVWMAGKAHLAGEKLGNGSRWKVIRHADGRFALGYHPGGPCEAGCGTHGGCWPNATEKRRWICSLICSLYSRRGVGDINGAGESICFCTPYCRDRYLASQRPTPTVANPGAMAGAVVAGATPDVKPEPAPARVAEDSRTKVSEVAASEAGAGRGCPDWCGTRGKPMSGNSLVLMSPKGDFHFNTMACRTAGNCVHSKPAVGPQGDAPAAPVAGEADTMPKRAHAWLTSRTPGLDAGVYAMVEFAKAEISRAAEPAQGKPVVHPWVQDEIDSTGHWVCADCGKLNHPERSVCINCGLDIGRHDARREPAQGKTEGRGVSTKCGACDNRPCLRACKRQSFPTPPTADDKLEEAIEHMLNRFSRESISGTPDYVIAPLLMDILRAFETATRRRDESRGTVRAASPAAEQPTAEEDLSRCGGCGDRDVVEWHEDREPGPDDPCAWIREPGIWVFDCKRQDVREAPSPDEELIRTKCPACGRPCADCDPGDADDGADKPVPHFDARGRLRHYCKGDCAVFDRQLPTVHLEIRCAKCHAEAEPGKLHCNNCAPDAPAATEQREAAREASSASMSEAVENPTAETHDREDSDAEHETVQSMSLMSPAARQMAPEARRARFCLDLEPEMGEECARPSGHPGAHRSDDGLTEWSETPAPWVDTPAAPEAREATTRNGHRETCSKVTGDGFAGCDCGWTDLEAREASGTAEPCPSDCGTNTADPQRHRRFWQGDIAYATEGCREAGRCLHPAAPQDPQPAPPGFRVVGRSGPGVPCRAGMWLDFARFKIGIPTGGPAPWRMDKAGIKNIPTGDWWAMWNAGCYDILEPIPAQEAAQEAPRCPPGCGTGDNHMAHDKRPCSTWGGAECFRSGPSGMDKGKNCWGTLACRDAGHCLNPSPTPAPATPARNCVNASCPGCALCREQATPEAPLSERMRAWAKERDGAGHYGVVLRIRAMADEVEKMEEGRRYWFDMAGELGHRVHAAKAEADALRGQRDAAYGDARSKQERMQRVINGADARVSEAVRGHETALEIARTQAVRALAERDEAISQRDRLATDMVKVNARLAGTPAPTSNREG